MRINPQDLLTIESLINHLPDTAEIRDGYSNGLRNLALHFQTVFEEENFMFDGMAASDDLLNQIELGLAVEDALYVLGKSNGLNIQSTSKATYFIEDSLAPRTRTNFVVNYSYLPVDKDYFLGNYVVDIFQNRSRVSVRGIAIGWTGPKRVHSSLESTFLNETAFSGDLLDDESFSDASASCSDELSQDSDVKQDDGFIETPFQINSGCMDIYLNGHFPRAAFISNQSPAFLVNKVGLYSHIVSSLDSTLNLIDRGPLILLRSYGIQSGSFQHDRETSLDLEIDISLESDYGRLLTVNAYSNQSAINVCALQEFQFVLKFLE